MSMLGIVVLVVFVAMTSAAIAAMIAYSRGHARGYEDCSMAWESFLRQHAAEAREDGADVFDLIAAGGGPRPAGRVRG